MKNLVDIAVSCVRYLVCDIGVRPAGSDHERLAFDFIEKQLVDCGYSVSRQSFSFSPQPRFFVLYIFGGILVAVAGIIVNYFPWFSLLLPVLIFALPQISRLHIQIGRKTAKSCNLMAEIESLDIKNSHNKEYDKTCNDKGRSEGEIEKCLILSAHVDSARANALTNQNLLRIYGQTFFWIQRSAIFISGVALLRLLSIQCPSILMELTAIIGLLAGIGWVIMEVLAQLRVFYSPGAYDNAAAIGVLIALAHYFSEHSQKHIKLRFLFTGAEEVGMIGAREYARSIERNQNDDIALLNFDLIGSGDLIDYVSLDGTICPVRTSKKMNKLIRTVNPNITGIWYTRQSGDYLPFIRAGISATSIQTSGNNDSKFFYHTIFDTIDLIQTSSLQNTIDFGIKFINEYIKLNEKSANS